jgi:acetate kinase
MARLTRVLVVNAGSTTLKLSAIGPGEETVATATVDHDDLEAIGGFEQQHGPFDASGHRIVHGGTALVAPAVIDNEVLKQLEALVPLAPLHQPAGIRGARAVMTALPGVPAVACFDTAFHAGLPLAAATYALPAAWRDRWPLRRFGFHGLSHEWASGRAVEILGRDRAGTRLVVCHLGGGSSLCAVADGRSQDTTMGFTPLEGLVMETRSGSVDPGLVLWLIREGGLQPAAVEDGLERHAGLAGLSGTDGDMRHVLAAADNGDRAARLALDVWAHRLRQAVAAMAASLAGIDGLVFTGGVGEHSAPLRARIVEGLAFLGVALDDGANQAAQGDADISGPGAACQVAVVTAREDLQIARHVRHTLG